MKLSLKNLKTALDCSTERRTVDDLKRSGTRSVRVISESQVVGLIEAIVEDTLAESGHVDPAERDRVVAAAKARFDGAMQQQAETEARNKNQEETILSLQQRITQLVNEKQALAQSQQKLEKQLDAALRGAAPVGAQPAAIVNVAADTRTPEELGRLTEGLGQLQSKLDAALRAPAPVVVQPAPVAADTRTPDELNRLVAGLAQLQSKLDAALAAPAPVAAQPAAAAPVDRMPEEMAKLAEGLAAMQQHLSRMDAKGSNTAADLDSRMEQSMQKLIDRFGKTVANATSKPTEKRVEATDALIGRMLDGDSGTMSNIGDLDVQERRAEGDIQKSLERLRRAKKGPAAAPAPNGSKDETATEEDRRAGTAERRADPQPPQDVRVERREGSEDRRAP